MTRQVICTVIEALSVDDLVTQIAEFTPMDVGFIPTFTRARRFTHFQIEDSGIEYMSLLDEKGEILWSDTVVLCLAGRVDCNCEHFEEDAPNVH